MRQVLVLDNPVQNYAWGSRTAIAELLGRPAPSARPEAELWMGAHPKAPSSIVEPPGLGTLDEAIRDDPAALLGKDVFERFGAELPFLFKVLAAAEPLSIQAHPSREQARAGWQRENEAAVPLDAPQRNYRDPNHKPELVCALTPFVALEGFRAPADIAGRLGALGCARLDEVVERLEREAAPAALRGMLAQLLSLAADDAAAVLQAAEALARRPDDEAAAWVGRLLRKYPGDVGVLAPLYLNLVRLSPGQALYLPAGELHAYLEGTALEIMANSDNVLRGGLTPKHVDAPELLRTLVFEPRVPRVLEAVAVRPGERAYQTPAREFELGLLEPSEGRPIEAPAEHGLEILLGLEGQPRLRAGASLQALGRGRCLVAPAALGGYTIEGSGRVARARVPA